MKKAPTKSAVANPTFRWQPLGGLGEVGMNAMVFRFGGTVVPVDAGILFADANDFGIEAVHVDYRELLVTERPSHWLITHAHEDHIGATAAIFQACSEESLDAPEIWAPPLAAALIRAKILDDNRYPDARKFLEKVRDIAPGDKLQIGDVTVSFLAARHSTLDTCSLAFEWDGGAQPLRVIHTADFKLDQHEYEDGVRTVGSTYGVFTDRGEATDFLFIDSTNSEREGHSVAEADILPALERLIEGAEGRVFLTLFSSNIQRIASLVQLGAKHGRYSCLAGRSMQNAHRIAMDLGLYGTSCGEILLSHLFDKDDISRHPPGKQLIICSGSQGEPRSVLNKLAQGSHANFTLGPDDRVIFSSKLIPGNEKSVSRLINGLLRQGAEVLWGETASELGGGPIHASGHARRDEIAAVVSYLKPKQVVPVHGELRQLMACAAIAREHVAAENVHVVENGTELSFDSDGHAGWQLTDRDVPTEVPQRVLRYDSFVTLSRDPFLRVRKRAASAGVVSVCSDSLGRIRLAVEGVFPASIYRGDFREGIESGIRDWIFAKFKQMPSKSFRENADSNLENSLAEDLARYVRRLTGLRPYVVFHLMGD